ncbi:DUF4097 family beta strand repeat-containing protein [Bacillus sp. 31A1R]|uniref:DUF4097 family beta strand repeat-containing protein n=1 Tax=Robertmurraya mangrovi TaxID=3098077 RepID=A0ABU5J3N3_9BACI|nr:DUF4097 family beta strand repeat-containing protein [Bacillus sp. 31A1R]MDZ5474030.1 DUF4097 family beta strand repeat-containing protein [Bacillus sp. 31A1R]
MKKFVLTLVVLFVIGVAGTLVTLNVSGGFSLEKYDVNDKVTVNNQNINDINIKLSSTDITVLPTSENEISVELKGKISKRLKNDLKLDVKEKGNTLDISLSGEDQIKFNIGVLIVETEVNVLLPEKIYESINVHTSSGEIAIEGLQSKDFILDVSSGEIIAEDLKAERIMKFSATSGEIRTKNTTAEKIEFEASSGDFIVQDQNSKESTFIVSSGDMQLTDVTGNIQLEASSGSISISNKEVSGNITADITSGDVEVEFRNKPTSLAIDFHASSGDGVVNLDGVTYEENSENRIIGKIGTGEYSVRVNASSGDFVLR